MIIYIYNLRLSLKALKNKETSSYLYDQNEDYQSLVVIKNYKFEFFFIFFKLLSFYFYFFIYTFLILLDQSPDSKC